MTAVETQNISAQCSGHVVQFYENDSELLSAVAAYLTSGAQADDSVAIVIATEDHLRAFQLELEARGVDIARASAAGRFIVLDARAAMATMIVDGQVDHGAFREVIGGLVSKASAAGRAVRVYGEIVALLWDAGNVLAAIELERLWNELAGEQSFSLFCAYPAASVAGSHHAEALHQVCHLHSAVLQPELADERELTASFPAERDAPGRARRLTVGALRRWGHNDELIDDAALVLSELASNAVIHAGSPFSIVVRSQGPTLRVAVEDVRPLAGAQPDGGLVVLPEHGLAVIEALAARWGSDGTPHGKVVWAELRVP
jgi:hypothetical protein